MISFSTQGWQFQWPQPKLYETKRNREEERKKTQEFQNEIHTTTAPAQENENDTEIEKANARNYNFWIRCTYIFAKLLPSLFIWAFTCSPFMPDSCRSVVFTLVLLLRAKATLAKQQQQPNSMELNYKKRCRWAYGHYTVMRSSPNENKIEAICNFRTAGFYCERARERNASFQFHFSLCFFSLFYFFVGRYFFVCIFSLLPLSYLTLRFASAYRYLHKYL